MAYTHDQKSCVVTDPSDTRPGLTSAQWWTQHAGIVASCGSGMQTPGVGLLYFSLPGFSGQGNLIKPSYHSAHHH
jgi:hypothetical protein